MNDDLYAIVNLNGYAKEMREAAAKSIADPFDDDLDMYISVKQMENLIKSECVGFDDKNRPLLNEDSNEKIYESTIAWIHNIGLAKLASKGLIECAWDDKENNFIFWANQQLDHINNNKEKSNDKPIKRRNKKKNKGS
jgi:hypothetical protein